MCFIVQKWSHIFVKLAFNTGLFLFSIFFTLASNLVLANEGMIERNGNETKAEISHHNIEMLAGLPKPPFIIEKNGAGLQLDIIREAFIAVNHSVSFSHIPLGRSISAFNRFNVDGIVTLPVDYQHSGIYISKPYVKYQNVAVSLSSENFALSSIQDLTGKSVIAFQNAKKFLGDEYNSSVSLSTDYREIADQMQQIKMLFSRRTQIIILDVNIFKFFVKSNIDGRYNKAFTIHYIFDEREYAAGFNTKQQRDLFDQGIELIKEQGIYQLVLDRYLN